MKEKIIEYIEDLESKANDSNKFFMERNKALEEIERLNNIIIRIKDKCNYLLNNEKVIINGKEYIKQNADDIITNYIMEELKGSDKE